MSEHDEEAGRRAVRAQLIEPLEEDGMRRHARTTVDAHKVFIDRLAEKLAYMRPENLRALKPLVASLGQGVALDIWPSLQAITQHAYRLQPPPDQSDDILWSWLHSIEGPRCREAGTLYATRRYIKKMRRPPVEDFAKKRIEEVQRDVDRDMEELRRLRGLGEATESQVAAILAHDRIVSDCEAIVDAGIRHRAARGVAA